MAIRKNGVETYKGQVLYTREHRWMDGMTDEYAVVWDMDEHQTKEIQIGYYGCDYRNMMGDVYAEADATEEVKRDVLRTLKRSAWVAFAKSVTEYKKQIHKGTRAEVIRGRKVKKGTILDVFWVGERETYQSRQYGWMNETETVAGAYDEDGNKVWIKVEYLKNIDPLKSPNAHERKRFIKNYVNAHRSDYRV